MPGSITSLLPGLPFFENLIYDDCNLTDTHRLWFITISNPASNPTDLLVKLRSRMNDMKARNRTFSVLPYVKNNAEKKVKFFICNRNNSQTWGKLSEITTTWL